ncbi:UNVERIFIED_CONTAM: O-acyltransferase WSD1 [Sesamum radiatum]|uniref:O-acyltransferase WSD1 n=1 Tax=Sesamum radiatum TaxID=300843 RepID=A0AAW2RV94_SESRA
MADTVEEDQPLTPAGRLFLQPLMNQVINCALGSDYPIDLGCVKTQIQNSIMLKHPRFCSLMVRDSSGREHWRKTQVDVDRHLIIHHHSLSNDPSISDEDAINDYMADLSFSSPLPTDKPLWEIHVLAAHKAVVFRVHHALGDGISLMSMLLSCCRKVDDPAQLPTIGGVGAASLVPRRWNVWTLMKVVWFTLVSILEFVLRLLWLRDKTTVLSGGSGVELWPRQLATARFRLDDMKTVKRALADSLCKRGPNHRIGHGKFEATVRTAVCEESQSNDPQEKAFVGGRYHIHSWIGSLPSLALSFLNYRIVCNTTFTISNIVGPREQITLAGHPVKFIRVTSSSLPHAITMHMLSYAGVADMQILVAKEVIPDPKVLAKCFEDALLEMKQAAEAAMKSQGSCQ